jgi:hypothetical protein
MLVLSIIAVIIALVLVVLFIGYTNNYSQRVYGYDIFNHYTFILSVIAYLSLYFGSKWYMSALESQGDTLNGALVMIIGASILLYVFEYNIKKTSFLYGVAMTCITEIVYAAATPVVFAFVLVAIAMLAETKPVYNIKD